MIGQLNEREAKIENRKQHFLSQVEAAKKHLSGYTFLRRNNFKQLLNHRGGGGNELCGFSLASTLSAILSIQWANPVVEPVNN